MASFSSSSFNAQSYSSNRPSYPPQLYSYIQSLTCPTTSPRTCLDLGCGPGLSTFPWLQFGFERVVGVEPSQVMVDVARALLEEKEDKGEIEKGRVRFERSSAEELGFIEDESIDLVVACTAAHWFDPHKVYFEISRILKPSGSFYFFGYFLPSLPSLPQAEKILNELNGQVLKEYWSEPGHTIASNLLSTFPLPFKENFREQEDLRRVMDSFDVKSLRRFFFLVSQSSSSGTRGEQEIDLLPAEKAKDVKIDKYYYSNESTSSSVSSDFDSSSVFLRRNWDLDQLLKLVSTWSGVFEWSERNGGRDLLGEFEKRMIEEGGWGEEGREKVELVWSIGGMGGRKKERASEMTT